MGSVKEYFQSLGSGIASLIKGLQVTGKELVTPKITEFYPEDRETRHVPERFRAILQLVYDKDGRHKCIACGTCERVCPNGTITLETKMVETADGKKKKKTTTNISTTLARALSASFACRIAPPTPSLSTTTSSKPFSRVKNF